jgi:pimeloyl-ACP methyl ester carboxylesterase
MKLTEGVINKENQTEGIPYLLRKGGNNNSIIIFITGSDDVKESYILAMELLADIKYSMFAFSFRGRETGAKYPEEGQIPELKEVITYLKSLGYSEFILVATSMGFVPCAGALSDANYSNDVSEVILFDPADYPLDASRRSWSGMSEFNPKSPLVSSLLRNIDSDTMIHNIYFGLRNYDEDYKLRSDKENGLDDPSRHPRLSKEMSLNITNEIPKKNRGKYIHDTKIPHHIGGHGDIRKNYERCVSYVRSLLDI